MPTPDTKSSGPRRRDGEPGSKPRRRSEEQIDETIEDSFPASDPPSFNPGAAHPVDENADRKDVEKRGGRTARRPTE
jgi:hypothetical protein